MVDDENLIAFIIRYRLGIDYVTSDFCLHGTYNTTYDTSIVASLAIFFIALFFQLFQM
jgi:hypothetical protein